MKFPYTVISLPLVISGLALWPLHAFAAPPAGISLPRSIQPPNGVASWQEPIEAPLPTPDSLDNREAVNAPCEDCGWKPGAKVVNHWRTVTKPCLQYTHWGYADQFQTRPFGAYMRGAIDTQVSNGIVAQIALYRFDFLDAQGEPAEGLSDRGRWQLEKTLNLMRMCDVPLVIEASGESRELDEARRANVLVELHQLGFPLAEDRVLIGRPLPRGLNADEANRLYYNTLQNFSAGGTGASISPASASGAGVSTNPVAVPPVNP